MSTIPSRFALSTFACDVPHKNTFIHYDVTTGPEGPPTFSAPGGILQFSQPKLFQVPSKSMPADVRHDECLSNVETDEGSRSRETSPTNSSTDNEVATACVSTTSNKFPQFESHIPCEFVGPTKPVPQFTCLPSQVQPMTASVPQKNPFIHFDTLVDATIWPPTFSAPAKFFQPPQLARTNTEVISGFMAPVFEMDNCGRSGATSPINSFTSKDNVSTDNEPATSCVNTLNNALPQCDVHVPCKIVGATRSMPKSSRLPAQVELQTTSVPQKNTFIHFDFPADAATVPPTFSAPAKFFQALQLGMPPAACLGVAQNNAEAENCEEPPLHSFASTESGDYPVYVDSDLTKNCGAGPNCSRAFLDKMVEGHVAPSLLQSVPPAPTHSAGSVLHESGKCEPCAWFWKPQGCKNGSECSRCHLCPQGAMKEAKKAKAKAKANLMRTPQSGSISSHEFPGKQAYCEGSTVVMQLANAVKADGKFDIGKSQEMEMPSLPIGASEPLVISSDRTTMELTHARGECKPCAYFWAKADGCRNGDDCQFCHICGKGEVKKRRKEFKKTSKMMMIPS